jgi:hypothetical protein
MPTSEGGLALFVTYARQRCGHCALCWVYDHIERGLYLGMTVALLIRAGLALPLLQLLLIAVIFVTAMWFQLAYSFIKLSGLEET